MRAIRTYGSVRGALSNGRSYRDTALGTSLPPHAHAKISRMPDRLDLVRAQIANLEQERDAVLENEAPDRAGGMIQQLATLRGIGVQSATVLVREAFVREFANGKALGSYAGLCATPYSSGGTEREQGISKAGNRRLRTVMVELAWLWQRYQPGSAQVSWFRERVGGTGARMRKVMVVALARKLLIALWRWLLLGSGVVRPGLGRRADEVWCASKSGSSRRRTDRIAGAVCCLAGGVAGQLAGRRHRRGAASSLRPRPNRASGHRPTTRIWPGLTIPGPQRLHTSHR